jgi:thymidylate synthase
MNIENQYLQLLKNILDNGVEKEDRTGTGTISVFGRQIRHDMSKGFPLLTTKKMYWKGIVTELLWFLRGDTNIKYLVDNDCHIWDGDCYKKYCKIAKAIEEPDYDIHVDDPNQNCTRLMTQPEFIERIKTDDEFARKWGGLGPIYGKQWRCRGRWKLEPVAWEHGAVTHFKRKYEVDQLANVIELLRTDPDSRRIILDAWNPRQLADMALPPCHYGFQAYTRELSDDERVKLYEQKTNTDTSFFPVLRETLDVHNIPARAISLMWNQRSVDTPLGLPFNIASYALLLHILAKAANMVPDQLIGNLGDVHIYKNQIDGVMEQINRQMDLLPKLKINSGNENWHLLNIDDIVSSLDNELTFKIEGYDPLPAIKFPLSN